jgi:predicted GNAT family N-acyltransferase
MRRDRKKMKDQELATNENFVKTEANTEEHFVAEDLEFDVLEELNLSQEPFSQDIINLRQNVLHPNGPVERVTYKPDIDPLAIHICIRKYGELVAVGSMLPEDEQEVRSEAMWRIRGMAVHFEMQGKGLGGLILTEMFEVLKTIESKTKVKVDLVWCNARVEALNLYTRFGFKVLDGEFDIPGSGPHRRLHLNT